MDMEDDEKKVPLAAGLQPWSIPISAPACQIPTPFMCANGHQQSHPVCFICHPTSTKDSYNLEQAATELRESQTPTALEAVSKPTLEDQSAPKVEEINKTPTCMETFSSINVAEMEERKTPALSFMNNDLLSQQQSSSLSLEKSKSKSKSMSRSRSKSNANDKKRRQKQWLELQKLLQRLEPHAIAHKMMERVDGGVRFSSDFINSFKRLGNKTMDPKSLVLELSRRLVEVSLTDDQERIYLDEEKRSMEKRTNYGDSFTFGPILIRRSKRVKKKIPVACGERRRISRKDIKRRS